MLPSDQDEFEDEQRGDGIVLVSSCSSLEQRGDSLFSSCSSLEQRGDSLVSSCLHLNRGVNRGVTV